MRVVATLLSPSTGHGIGSRVWFRVGEDDGSLLELGTIVGSSSGAWSVRCDDGTMCTVLDLEIVGLA